MSKQNATMSVGNDHYFDENGFDVWGYDRAGHYVSAHDRRPFQASPYPTCLGCDETTCDQREGV